MMELKKTYIHTFAMLLMGEKGLSQTGLAEVANVGVPFLNQVLLCKKTSAPVQEVIATSLGFENWKRLDQAALLFSDNFSNMYNLPTLRPIKEAHDVDKRKDVI